MYFLDIIAQHLELLSRGEPVLIPVYNRSTGVFDRSVYVEPTEIVIAEGLHTWSTARLRSAFDVKVFLDPAESLRAQWKLARDVGMRRRSEAEVRGEMLAWRTDSETFIAPQRKWADLIVELLPTQLRVDGPAVLDRVSLLLRPTLPRPTLADLFLTPCEGIQLNLDRDMGITVDRLDIPAVALDKRFVETEAALWRQITLKKDEIHPAGVGQIVGPGGATETSPAMVVSQLVAALQAVAAGTDISG